MATQPGTLELILGEIGPILARVEQRFAPENILLTFAELGLEFPPELLSDSALVTSLTSAASAAAAIPDDLQHVTDALDADDTTAVVQAVVAVVQQLRAVLNDVDDV